MKKVLLSLFIVLVLSWACGMVFAKGEGKGKSARGRGKAVSKIEEKKKARQANANEPGGQSKGKQDRKRRQRPIPEQERRQLHEKMRQRMRETRRKGEGKSEAAVSGKEAGKGRDHRQQLEAFKAQMVHEGAKHRRRLVRLKRIRELAVQAGNTKAVERVDKLLRKEYQRYGRKQQRMSTRAARPRIRGPRGKSLSEEGVKPIKKGVYKKKAEEEDKNKGTSKDVGK